MQNGGALIEKTLGFIGGGQMCEAILSGALKAGALSADRVLVSDVAGQRLQVLKESYGIVPVPAGEGGEGARRLVNDCDIVVLSIKPQIAPKLLASLNGAGAGKLFLSIMGGVRLATLEAQLPGSAVIRVMPNTPMLVRRGSAGVALGCGVSEEQLALCQELFTAVGSCYVVEEKLIDPLTGVSGCGPAFACLFVEALADGGVAEGLPRELALRLAAETLAGSAEMLLQTGEHPACLKDKVCSPGGGTIVGVRALEEGGLRAAVENAVAAACRRMAQLGADD